MTNYLSIIVAAALVNNLALVQLLGVSSLFYSTRRLTLAVEFAFFNFIVLFLSSVINICLYRYVLVPLELNFLRIVIFVATGSCLVMMLLQKIEAIFPLTMRQQSLLLFLTAGNSAVLGNALLSSENVLDLAENITYSLGAALGFALTIIFFAAMRIRLQSADVPAPFQGSAIQLVAAGLIAIALSGFAGIS